MTLRGLALTLCFCPLAGCGDDDADDSSSVVADEEPRHGLTAEQAAQLLVTIGDREVTVGEFADRLAEESPHIRMRYNNPQRRREYLDNLVRFELLALEAEEQGLDQLPAVQRARKQQMVQQMVRSLFEDEIRMSDITDEEIAAYYEEHREEFEQPAQRRASHILVADRATAERLLRQLKAADRPDELFRALADRHNLDPASRDRFGDLHFFPAPASDDTDASVPAPVARAAFALETIGDFAEEPVESDQGFHVVRLTAKRPALTRRLEDARRTIQSQLHRERRDSAMQSFLTELREETEIEEHYELLTSVEIELPQAGGEVPALEAPEDGAGAPSMAGGAPAPGPSAAADREQP